ncbi:LysR substrate-binding domain-containing protein [Planktotalea sp.]|uniref:LysR substrate-binding domain-containing protein n=1 Tax=Planktotalea sp. TaxID=2029877 RepID=UPI0025ED98A2|nr:LysR substrate-binding domain-containing protein [Planktotalea sp.]
MPARSLPRRYLPSLASLRALEALDRLGTATAAAEELSLTQSAVSRQLQVLEDQLGASLILRNKRRMLMTDAGKRYASEIRAALSQITRASMQLHVHPGAGGLSLAILPSFGMRWLVPRLAHFATLHPDVTVNLSTRLNVVAFDTEPFDAAIQYGNGHWPNCQSLLLRYETLIPICSRDLLKNGPVKTASDLSSLPLLHIQTRPNAWNTWLTQNDAPPPKTSGTQFDQFSTITQAAIHGLGVALLPDFIAEQELAAGRLINAYGGATRSLGAYYLVWPNRDVSSPALALFRDWLATQTEDEDGLPR